MEEAPAVTNTEQEKTPPLEVAPAADGGPSELTPDGALSPGSASRKKKAKDGIAVTAHPFATPEGPTAELGAMNLGPVSLPAKAPLDLKHERLTGVVSKYTPSNGWGVVKSHLFEGELTFRSDRIMPEFQGHPLNEGENVEFDVQADDHGRPHAVAMKPMLGRRPTDCLGQRHRGYVRRFAERWGFLNAAAFDGDLFVHRDNLLPVPDQLCDGQPPLRAGQAVEFDVALDDRGRAVAKQITTRALLRPCDWIGHRLRGYVRSFQGAWGFINSDRFAGDLFVHRDSLMAQHQNSNLTVGTIVEFDVERDHHRKGAKNRLVARHVGVLGSGETVSQQPAAYSALPPTHPLPGAPLPPQAPIHMDPAVAAAYGGSLPAQHMHPAYGAMNPQAPSFAPQQPMYYAQPAPPAVGLTLEQHQQLAAYGAQQYPYGSPAPYPPYAAQPQYPMQPQPLLPQQPPPPQYGQPPYGTMPQYSQPQPYAPQYGVPPPQPQPAQPHATMPQGTLPPPAGALPGAGVLPPLAQQHAQVQQLPGQAPGAPSPEELQQRALQAQAAQAAQAQQPQVQAQQPQAILGSMAPEPPKADGSLAVAGAPLAPNAPGAVPVQGEGTSQGLLHITMHDWEPDQPGQLWVTKGTLVSVSYRAAHGWVYAGTVQPGSDSGEPASEGWVPQAVVKRVSLCRVSLDWPDEGAGTLGVSRGEIVAVSKEAERGWVYGERIGPRQPDRPSDGWLPKKVLDYLQS